MDMSTYKDQFISEAQESLENLNTYLVELEKQPTDDLINKIFRAFHTLKGNAATMGFVKFSHLAHDLEDLLDRVRNKQIDLSSEVVDIMLDGMDALNDGVNYIESGHSEQFDISDMVRRIKDVLGSSSTEKIKTYTPPPTVDVHTEPGKRAVRVLLKFQQDNPLRLVKSRLAVKKLSASNAVLYLQPDIQNLEMSVDSVGSVVDLVLGTSLNDEEIKQRVAKIVGLETQLRTPDEPLEKTQEEHHTEKEQDKSKITSKHLSSAIKQVQSVKVNLTQLDSLMNLVGELLIVKMRLDQTTKRMRDRQLDELLLILDRLTLALQDEVMTVRMIPIGYIFNKFPRMIRDLAKKEGKDVNLEMKGEDLELDRTVLDEIGDPLVHLLRNSVDHGIESPDEREKSGKERMGNLHLIARREKNYANIEIIDDGAGIDPEVVKEMAVKKGTITPEQAAKLSDDEAQRLIFMPGLSTNKVVTDVSGRGVGMDVVETKIRALGGNIKLKSVVGEGTTITLQLPLTVAIIAALLIEVGSGIYALPLSSIKRTVRAEASALKEVKGEKVLIQQGKAIPLINLHENLHEDPLKDLAGTTVVIVDKDNEEVGLPINKVVAQQQILIKSLDKNLRKTKGISGATILGDGSVALLVDIASLR